MKPTSNPLLIRRLASTVLFLSAPGGALDAATIQWANAAGDFNQGAAWVGGAAPTASDVATFSGPAVVQPVLSAPTAVLGLSFATADAAGYTVSGAAFTLGTSGIDGSALAGGVNTITGNLTLANGGQTWSLGAGSTLALTSGTFTRGAGSALNLNDAGAVTSTMTGLANVNAILGPWASAGSSTSTRYATLAAGAVTPFTGGTAVAAFGWPSGNNNTFNYDVAGVQGNLGVGRQAQTARYTGAGGTQNWGNNNTTTVTLNGLMNAGTGTLTFSEAGGTSQGQLGIGTQNGNELVLSAAAADLQINIPVINTGSNAGSLLITGPNTVNITSSGGASTYTGATTVASGTLHVSGAGAINSTSGITVNGAAARYLHTSSVASTRSLTLVRGTLDGTGTLAALTVADEPQAVITHGNGGTGPLTLASLAFGGDATLNLNRGTSVPVVVAGAMTTTPANGKVVVNVSSSFWNLGTTDLITSGGFTGAAGDFELGTVTGLGPRQAVGGLVVEGGRLAIRIDGDLPVWTGAAGGSWSTDAVAAPGNWRLGKGGTRTDFLSGDLCLFDDTSTGTTAIDIPQNDVFPASTTFDNSSKDYTLDSTAGRGIATGTLVKSGTGRLTLGAGLFNYHDGGTTFSGGLLEVNGSNALGIGPVTIAPGQAKSLDNTSGGDVFLASTSQSWNDDFIFKGSGNLDMGSATVTLGGAGVSRSVDVASGTLVVGELKSATHGFEKRGSGTLAVASSGAGTAASLIGGPLVVSAGTLQINRTDASAVTSGDFTATGLAGTGTVVNGAAVERWLFVNTTASETFDGLLANGGGGPLGLNKQGVGTLVLTCANTYSGQTTVEGGTLVVGNPSALGSTVLVRLINGTTLDLATDEDNTAWPIGMGTGTTTTILSNRATEGPGINHTLTTQSLANGLGGGTINIVGGANVTSGTPRVTFSQFGLGAGTVQTTTLNPTTATVTVGDVAKQNNNVSQTLGLGGTSTGNEVVGVISNGSALISPNNVSVLKTGTGVWTLSNTNTFTGNATLGAGGLPAGVLRATANGALGAGTIVFDPTGNLSDAQLVIAGGITLNNPVSLPSRLVATPAIVNESGTNTLAGNFTLGTGGDQLRLQSDAGQLVLSGTITTGATTARNLYLQGAGDGLLSGVLSDNPTSPTGTIHLIKEGSGTWTLSGPNTTTGTTTVNAGVLVVSGSLGDTALTVNTGATLRGTGTIGTSAGTVRVASGGRLAATIASSPAGQTPLKIQGTLTLDAGHVLDLIAEQAPADGVYVLASATGGVTFDATGSAVNLTGLAGTVSVSGNDLVLRVGSGGGYGTWAATHAGGQSADLDFNGDGVANGIAYFMNQTGNGVLPGVVAGAVTWPNGGNIPAAAYGTEFVVESSTDLSLWSEVPAASITTNTDGPGGALVCTLPAGMGKVFVRLKVIPK